MALWYRRVDRDQVFLIPPDMREWLPVDHVVWFLIEAVEQMDTGAFHRHARLGGAGRRGYDPEMLLTLFVYAMAQGVSSSRKIEQLCHTDVAFRIICAQDVPDHTVLARFRQTHEEALKAFLTESLVLAARLGMVCLGVVALDGTKIAANASIGANRAEKGLRKLAERYLDQVGDTDAADDARWGSARGDELPPSVRDKSNRKGRIKQALAQVKESKDRQDADQQALEERAREFEADIAAGVKVKGQAPKGTDPVRVGWLIWERERAEAEQRYADYLARCAARGGRRPPGPPVLPPEEHHAVRGAWKRYEQRKAAAAQRVVSNARRVGQTKGSDPEVIRVNVTDPESRLLKTRNGWIQGLNCQTSASQDMFLLTARATQDANDAAQFVPTITALEDVMHTVAKRSARSDLAPEQIGTTIADAGYDSDNNLAAPGPERLIADGNHRGIKARAAADPATGQPPPEATERERMNHRLRTPEGIALYRRRSHLIETPNAWLKDRRGLRRFARRGLSAAQAELSLAAGVTNLLRIATQGITAAQLKTS